MNATRLQQSRAALLALVAPEIDTRPGAVPALDDVDWAWILERATAHKLAPLLAARIERLGITVRLPAAERERVAAVRAAAARHVGVARRTLAFIDRGFRDADIPYLVVKGSALSELVYPEPDHRTFSDVDVVVSPRRVARAADVLQSLGCRLGQVRQTLGSAPPEGEELDAARRVTRAFYERFEYELPFLAPARSELLPVDLHWQIAASYRIRASFDDLWARTRRVDIGGIEVTTLDAEATAIHVAIHATTCAYAGFRMLHLCDVAWAAARAGAGLDELAARWKADRHLRMVLAMARRFFPAEGAANGAGAARPRGLAIGEDFLIDRPPSPQLGRLWRELYWGFAMGCLGRNVRRSLGIRLTRARWRWARRGVRPS